MSNRRLSESETSGKHGEASAGAKPAALDAGRNPWKERVLEYNRKRKEEGEKAADLMRLLEALPPGQRKQLMKDAACGAILKKYGIGGES